MTEPAPAWAKVLQPEGGGVGPSADCRRCGCAVVVAANSPTNTVRRALKMACNSRNAVLGSPAWNAPCLLGGPGIRFSPTP